MTSVEQARLRVQQTREALAAAEAALVLAALRETRGNRTHAAALAGLSVRTVYRRIAEDPDAYPAAPPNVPPQLR